MPITRSLARIRLKNKSLLRHCNFSECMTSQKCRSDDQCIAPNRVSKPLVVILVCHMVSLCQILDSKCPEFDIESFIFFSIITKLK